MKAKPHGNHALLPVGANLSGMAVAEEFKTSATRVLIFYPMTFLQTNMPSSTATSVSLASTSVATVTSIATATTTSVTSDFVIK